jgi:hypothetical protein
MLTVDLNCGDCGAYGEGVVLQKEGEAGVGMPRRWGFRILPSNNKIVPLCDGCKTKRPGDPLVFPYTKR